MTTLVILCPVINKIPRWHISNHVGGIQVTLGHVTPDHRQTSRDHYIHNEEPILYYQSMSLKGLVVITVHIYAPLQILNTSKVLILANFLAKL